MRRFGLLSGTPFGLLNGRPYNIACDGNSLTYGWTVSSPAHAYPAMLQVALHTRYAVTNMGIGGQTTQQMVTLFDDPGHPGPLFDADVCNVLVAWELTNDIRLGLCTEQQAMGNWATYVRIARAHGYRVMAMNCLPSTAFNATTESIRLACNVEMGANVGKIFGDTVIDMAAEFPNPLDPTWYSDGTHLNDAGYARVANVVRQELLGQGYS